MKGRPYVASSLTRVALREAFSSALAGKSRERAELVNEKPADRERPRRHRVRGLAEDDEEAQAAEDAFEDRVKLSDQRMEAVLSALRSGGPPITRVIDLGCEEGRLLKSLLADRAFSEIVGVHVSPDALAEAERRIRRRCANAQAHSRLRDLPWLLTGRRRVIPYGIQWLKRKRPASFRQDLRALFDLLQQQGIKLIARLFPLAEAGRAHELLG